MQLNRVAALLLTLTGATIAPLHAQSRVNTPTVRVNGEPLSFQGQPPIERSGRVLVPLRGIFERLGAFVDYDSLTKTVTAIRGKTSIALTVGERQVQVSGRTLILDTPAQSVRGTVLVPLRFVAEALGAKVFYDAPNGTVNIKSNLDPAPPGPQPNPPDNNPLALGEVTVTGTVVAVYADLEPRRIVVRPRNSQAEKTVPLFPDTVVQLHRDGSDTPFSLSRITPGDTVIVHEAADGVAISIDVQGAPTRAPRPQPKPTPPGPRPAPADPNVFKGELSHLDKLPDRLYLLTMRDGRIVTVPENVPITYDGQNIGINELRSGDRLTVTTDPRTRRGKRIVVAY